MAKRLKLPHDLAERMEAEQISATVLVQAVRRAVEHPRPTPSLVSGASKADAFHAWVESHQDITAVVLDDSREAIYRYG